MKTRTFLFHIILLFCISVPNGYSQFNKSSNNSNGSEYFPMEVGQYWKYKCILQKSSTGSSTIKEESEVLIQITSKTSDNVYLAKVTIGDISSFQTITVNENGDLFNENGKLLLCQSRTSVNPDDYKSILGYPKMSGSLYTSSGDVNITKLNGTLEAKYDGIEFRSGTTSTKCEHHFDEKFEKDKGMTYTYYMKFITTSWYISGAIHSVGSYSSWTYTLIDYSPPSTLLISPSNQNVTSTAGNKPFTVTSNIPWTASSDQAWCAVTSSGTGNGIITATYQANPTTAIRTATITVSGTGVTAQTITVTQEGAIGALTVSSNTLTIAAPANSTKTFDINSNISWKAVSNQGWLTLSSASDSNNATITLTAGANPTTSTRIATVTISGTGVTAQTITVTQDGAIGALTVSSNTLTIAAPANSTKTFDITSNISWTTASNQGWLTLSSASGSNNSTITLTAGSNPSTTTRTATVTVSGSGVTTLTITVTQDAGTTGIIEIGNSTITIFPNPVNETLFIKGLSQNSTISIIDLNGKILISKLITDNQIDISKLANGVYSIKIMDKNETISGKFIKQ